MKKVSVIIPTYKRNDFLERAIHSIINQTYKNIEIIVVDDNDEDSEYRKINENKMVFLLSRYSNLFYLKHERNLNGAAARNTGLKFCSGDYITFLDDDDFFLSTRIEKLVKLLEENKEYDCAYSSVALIDNNKKLLKIYNAQLNGNLQLEMLKQHNFIGTGSNMFFRKNAIKNIGFFDENFFRHQDVEYMVRYFNYGKIINLDEILVIKCCEDKINVPNYEKMLLIKKMFLEKFSKEIKSDKSVYFENYLELLYLFIDNNKYYLNLLYILKNIHPIPFKLKLKLFYKKYLKRISIFKYFSKLREPKYYLDSDVQDEINNIISSYARNDSIGGNI